MTENSPFYDNFFVRRPIVAIVIAIVTVIIGVVSLLGLSIEQYPDISPPMVSVRATYFQPWPERLRCYTFSFSHFIESGDRREPGDFVFMF